MIMFISSTIANELIKIYQTTTLSYIVLMYSKHSADGNQCKYD